MRTTEFLKKGGKLLIGKLALYLNMFVSSVVFARGLGAMGYGVLMLGISILSIVGTIFGFGLSASNKHFIAKYFKKNKDKAIKILKFLFKWRGALGIILALTVLGSSGWIAGFYNNPKLSVVLRILIIGFFFNFLENIPLTAFKGIKKMILVSYKNIFWSIAKLIPITLAALGFGLIAISWSYTLVFISTFALCLYLLLKEIDIFKKTGEAFNKGEVLNYSFLSYGTSLLNLGLFKATAIITGLLSVANVGFLNIGNRIGKAVVFLVLPLSEVLGPTLSDLWNRNKERAKVLFRRITRYKIFLTLPFIFLVFLYGKSGIRYIYGKGFLPAFNVLMIFSLGHGIRGLLGSFQQLSAGSENVDVSLKGRIISVILNLGLAFILIPSYGLIGGVTALAAGLVVGNLWESYKIKSKTGVGYPIKAIGKSLIASGLASAASYPVFLLLHLRIIEFIPVLIVFGLVYIGILFLLKGFKDFEIEFIKMFIKEKRYLHYLKLK